MASSHIYAGLEIGTSKVCFVVGEVRGDGSLKILGVGQQPAAGVRKGEVIDGETVQSCLAEALERAEDRSDVEINTVFLSVSGAHIQGINSRGAIRLSEGEISAEDLDEVKRKCREVEIQPENGFIHSIIQHYYIDGQRRVVNPEGMFGQKLEADYHIIHGVKSRIHNSIKTVRDSGLEVEDIVFGGVASAQVTLDRETKQRGCLMLDIGGGTTDYLCFVDGAVVASGCVGVGGDHITNDIAVVLKVPLARAEKLKVTYGSAWLESINPTEQVPIEAEGSETVDRLLICQIINARLSELLTLIDNSLAHDNILAKTSGGVHLTGGSSLITGLDELVSDIFKLPVIRTGKSTVSGPTALFENPQYATPVGLIRYAQLLNEQRPHEGTISKLGQTVGKLFGSNRQS